MSASMRMDIDTTRVVLLADAFGANIKQMEKAQFRAINKTMRWLKTQVVRGVSKEVKIAAKIIRKRVAVFSAKKTKRYARAWVGLNPLPAHRLGNIKKLRKGVRAGKHTIPGGFAVDTGAGKTVIFKRTGESKRTAKRGRYAGTSVKREPIERVEIELDTPAVREQLAKLFRKVQDRYFDVFKQELKFQVFVKSA